jgi:hypothetical protein
VGDWPACLGTPTQCIRAHAPESGTGSAAYGASRIFHGPGLAPAASDSAAEYDGDPGLPATASDTAAAQNDGRPGVAVHHNGGSEAGARSATAAGPASGTAANSATADAS